MGRVRPRIVLLREPCEEHNMSIAVAAGKLVSGVYQMRPAGPFEEQCQAGRTRRLRFGAGTTDIVGSSAALQTALRQIEHVARTDATVLLLGETGTGKDLFAARLHVLSPRSTRSMVRVNCAALPSTLIESELFGRERGAFTGPEPRATERAIILATGPLLSIRVPCVTISGAIRSTKLEDVVRDHIQNVVERAGWRIRGAGGAAERQGSRRQRSRRE
jgi:hypothetical protein